METIMPKQFDGLITPVVGINEARAHIINARGSEKSPSAHTKERKRLALTWQAFELEEFPQGEQIAFGVERGEVALLVSLPNAGKTTLSLNAAISICLGRSFGTIASGGKARKVLYIDGETRRARLQRDLKRMQFGLDPSSKDQLREQLFIVCEQEVDGESLSLTNNKHFLEVCADAIDLKPDLIVIDTMASLCPVYSENDNAEQQRKVWRPLQKLAREADSAILVIHHVGKRSEDSQTPERVYRGRGASASGAFARSVWILSPDPLTQGLVTLNCAKIKGELPPDARFALDLQTRWFQPLEALPKQKTGLEIVAETVTQRMSTKEIVKALEGRFSERSVKEYLSEAVETGYVIKVKTGVYEPAGVDSADCEPEGDARPAQAALL